MVLAKLELSKGLPLKRQNRQMIFKEKEKILGKVKTLLLFFLQMNEIQLYSELVYSYLILIFSFFL
jgi:hypothetical protein